MIFINEYPKINGASDLEDSSHLAGILAIMEHPEAVECSKYVFAQEPKPIYKRHPDSKYDFSRDQFILLAAGLIKQGHWELVNINYINGKDILPPSVRGMVRIAQGKTPHWFQKLWLKGEIYWHSYLQPLEEPFQIIALCSVYGDEYLKLWTKHNTKWQWSIKRYLSELDGAWRNEKELAEFVIQKCAAVA
jgi:hypothetical protein